MESRPRPMTVRNHAVCDCGYEGKYRPKLVDAVRDGDAHAKRVHGMVDAPYGGHVVYPDEL